MQNRDMSLDDCGIGPWEYRELKAFCRQYDEKKEKAEDLLHQTGAKLTGMPRGGKISDPVCITAVIREKLLRDCEMIEQAAKEADPAGYEAILKNVTRGTPYEQCGYRGAKSPFFRARKEFFLQLYQKRWLENKALRSG